MLRSIKFDIVMDEFFKKFKKTQENLLFNFIFLSLFNANVAHGYNSHDPF